MHLSPPPLRPAHATCVPARCLTRPSSGEAPAKLPSRRRPRVHHVPRTRSRKRPREPRRPVRRARRSARSPTRSRARRRSRNRHCRSLRGPSRTASPMRRSLAAGSGLAAPAVAMLRMTTRAGHHSGLARISSIWIHGSALGNIAILRIAVYRRVSSAHGGAMRAVKQVTCALAPRAAQQRRPRGRRRHVRRARRAERFSIV